ncbi:MAG: hypothetical protein K0R39_2137 [Symbiobacteriaceae bacterium]|nr:hypothetical protein [Symbiobacteriaceae bacterium]
MSYIAQATSKTPALVIYLLDISLSMYQPLGDRRRIDVVMDALDAAVGQMVFRSTKGSRIAPRYRMALFAYNDQTYDVFQGIQSVDRVAHMGLPELEPARTTDTARGFEAVERLLETELPAMTNHPAPIVCHITDGEYTGQDPEPAVRRIMQMAVPDGHVLVQNIFISDTVLTEPIADLRRWPGILPETVLTDEYARKLRAISSPLPDSYRAMIVESGYRLDPRAVMMLPGASPDLVSMGLQISSATPIR